MSRKAYPTDVSDQEWDFALPYLALITTETLQRHYDLRKIFNALRWLVRAGAPWCCLLPNDLPSWQAVYQQTRRWLQDGCFEATRIYARSFVSIKADKANPAR